MSPKTSQSSSPTACICPKYHSLSLLCAKRSDMITWIHYPVQLLLDPCSEVHIKAIFNSNKKQIAERHNMHQIFPPPLSISPKPPLLQPFQGWHLTKRWNDSSPFGVGFYQTKTVLMNRRLVYLLHEHGNMYHAKDSD